MSAANGRIERLRQPDDFRKVFALAIQTVLVLMTVVVLSRRMSGAFHGSIAPVVPCLVATIAAFFSLASLALQITAPSIASTRKWMVATTTAVLPPVVLGAALWMVPSAVVGGYLAALATASVLCAVAIRDSASGFAFMNRLQSALFQGQVTQQWVALDLGKLSRVAACPPASHSRVSNEPTGGQAASATPPRSSATPQIPLADLTADEESVAIPDEESESDQSIVQWMTRRRLPDGGEVVEGAVRIDLDPAEKVGVAHLSFVPPLACDPKAECHLLCDFGGRVRITAARSYGLRIEARQSGELTLATTINVAFSAQAPPAASRAAAA
jgi:hypothetical protein